MTPRIPRIPGQPGAGWLLRADADDLPSLYWSNVVGWTRYRQDATRYSSAAGARAVAEHLETARRVRVVRAGT